MVSTARTLRSTRTGGGIAALAVLGLVAVTACTSSSNAHSTTTTPSVVASAVRPPSVLTPTSASLKPLPDPVPADHPLDVTVLSAGSGHGSVRIQLPASHLRDKSTSIRWICVGPGSLTFRDSKGVLVSSPCGSLPDSGSVIRGGDIPQRVSDLSDLSINAGAQTRWRYSVYSVHARQT